MVTRKLIRATSPEAAALAASSSSAAAPTSTKKSTDGNTNKNNGGGKKRALPSGDAAGGKVIKKRQRTDDFVLDLSDVQPQQPIPKSKGHIKEGASKYMGVSFNKALNKWTARITIDGKSRYIGCYDNEEEAAIDYARAVFKYQGQDALNNLRERNNSSAIAIDLSDVPPQSPIPKSDGRSKAGASKYTGVYFNKQTNKWHAQISIDGKVRHIGFYENEEAAGIDYTRAVFKYQGQDALNNLRERNNSSAFAIDLSDVPPQQPIPKRKGHIKEGASKYAGVFLIKATSKWQAQITIEGKDRYIGCYENEEEAAIDYARAVFKYKGENALVKARELTLSAIAIDLSDVPPQQPIPKRKGHIKEGASKYTGVSFSKTINKWTATIMIEGKNRRIGDYVNEEEAAIDYARAVFKYKGQEALDKVREQNKQSVPAIDLSNVPPQQPIPKSEGCIKEGSSKYTGVYFNKSANKWAAQIKLEGKKRHIGCYEKEEEAAIDYARAVFKYKGNDTLDTTEPSSVMNDLRGDPLQPPFRSEGHLEGASK